MIRRIGKQSGISVESVLKEKRKATVDRIYLFIMKINENRTKVHNENFFNVERFTNLRVRKGKF